MRSKNKNLFVPVLIVSLLLVSLIMPQTLKVQAAATMPTLGTTSTYAALGASTITSSGSTVLNGDLGLKPGTSVTGFTFSIIPGAGIVNGNVHINDAAAIQAQTDATSAYNGLNQSCDFGPVGPTDLAGQVLTPGVHCYSSSVQISVGGVLHLDAQGNPNAVWIFKTGSTLTTISGSSIVFDNVGQACNVFWQVGSSATLGTNTSFVGSIIAAHDVSLNTNANVNGRVMALGVAADGAISLLGNTITVPTCTVASTGGNNTITVIKEVINDNGGTAVYTDFPLFINGNPVSSGQSVALIPGLYTITETNRPGYARTFTGNCNAAGVVDHGGLNTHNDVCVVVNNDIGVPAVPPVPPLIDVLKIPSPLALPLGPGLVNYTYTVKNIGTVPMTNVTLVDDTCSPMVLSSGDTNNDSVLALNEIWIYHCSTTLSATHTNTVVATGHANGLTAVAVASATVVVGLPIVPPLIHVTKIPNPLTLLNGGGMVTYTNKITNPGTIPLSNVTITDDKCAPEQYISGDTNNNSKLDPTETWTYTCKTNLTKTTSNTVTVTGTANGLTATAFAIATVVVAKPVPKLPNSGLAPTQTILGWSLLIAGISSVLSLLFIARTNKLSK